MNNLAETEQEREYRKSKNAIVGMIFLNICPVYAGKIHTANNHHLGSHGQGNTHQSRSILDNIT